LNEGADFTSALNDLAKGREFYEKQAEGVGSYFFDSVFADIDNFRFSEVFTAKFLDIIGCSHIVFPLPSITNRCRRFSGCSSSFGLQAGSDEDTSGIEMT